MDDRSRDYVSRDSLFRACGSLVEGMVSRTDLEHADIKQLRSLIDQLRQTVRTQQDDIKTLNKILFGDGENQKGLLGRQLTLEDRFKTLWGAIGVFGTGVIIAIVNILMKHFNI